MAKGLMSPGVSFPILSRVLGTTGAPAYSFTGETNSGLRLQAAGDLRLTVAGTDVLTMSAAAVALNVAAFNPVTDSTPSLGTAALRFANIVGNAVKCFASASDANPVVQLTNVTGQEIRMGIGGASALDLFLTRGGGGGAAELDVQGGGTLSSSPADKAVLSLFFACNSNTITRLNYVNCNSPSGTTTITDATALAFDAGPGTHKALAANGAVATVLGSLGPVGSQTTVQGWIKLNVAGTLRYVPFF